MAFICITCGTHTFQSQLKGYEDVNARCQNCGNFSAKAYKRWEWFTVCFLPLVPFSIKPYNELGCHICNFYQDMKYRPDVEQGHGNSMPMQGTNGQGGQLVGQSGNVPQYK